MKAYGSKRCYHECRVTRAGNGRKVTFTIGVKSKKSARSVVDLNETKNSGEEQEQEQVKKSSKTPESVL